MSHYELDQSLQDLFQNLTMNESIGLHVHVHMHTA